MMVWLLLMSFGFATPIDSVLDEIPLAGFTVERTDPTIAYFPSKPARMSGSIFTSSAFWLGEALRQWQKDQITPDSTQEVFPIGFKSVFSLRHSGREMLQWNGCERSSLVQGGAQNSTAWPRETRCNTALLNDDFARQLSKYFLSCLQEGARAAGIPEPVSVFVMHAGTYRRKAMLHGVARAMDLCFVNFRDDKGEVYFTFNTHRPAGVRKTDAYRVYETQNRTVYDKFRLCWKRNLPVRGCTYTGGSIGYQGATPVAFNRGDHNDHIHLELAPNCGPVRIEVASPRFQFTKTSF